MKSITGKELSVAENQKLNPMPDDEAQSRRFIEDAKLLEVDESGDAFERAMGVVTPPINHPKPERK